MDLKRIRLSEGEIPYIELGHGPDLLFLHGAIATAEAYIPLLTLLGRDYHVVAPIHPGHGTSFSIPRDWKLVDFVRFYQDFLIELTLAPTLLIGHSFGGTMSLLLALKGIGTHVIVMDSPGLPFQFELTQYGKALLNESRDVMKRRPDLKEFLEITKAAGTLLQTTILHPKQISLFVKQGPKMDIYRELKQLTIPVDLLWGELDQVVPLEVGQKMVQFLSRGSLTVFPDKGHNYSVTDPDFTYQELLKVIKRPVA